MRTLIYKRTHKGDPDVKGHFGVSDCMGRVRQYPFDAVIGIGGIGRELAAKGIRGKVNWTGIGAEKSIRFSVDLTLSLRSITLFCSKSRA